MSAIVTSLLAAGGWGLVVGWILPTALNSLLFGLLVLPTWKHVPALNGVATASTPVKALALLVAAVVGGLLLSALQTPLYRILEGYTWPSPAKQWGVSRQLRRKESLDARWRLARLMQREKARKLSDAEAHELSGFWPELLAVGRRQTQKWQVSVLAESLRRYPVDNRQVLPSVLGNAIRRFEEYGYDRYRLDVVTMWYALTGVVPKQVRKQVADSRAGVDFFVCLIYGHIIVALSAVADLAAVPDHPVGPVVAIVATVVLSFLWYRLAVSATDEWAAAVRGLVDTGRKPLAASLNLAMPRTLELERRMWQMVSRLGRQPHSDRDSKLDQFRI
jgi:hypothetical protein